MLTGGGKFCITRPETPLRPSTSTVPQVSRHFSVRSRQKHECLALRCLDTGNFGASSTVPALEYDMMDDN